MTVRFYNIVWVLNAPDIFFLWEHQGVDGDKDGILQYGNGTLEDILEAAATEKRRLPEEFVFECNKSDDIESCFDWINDHCNAHLNVCNYFETEIIKE